MRAQVKKRPARTSSQPPFGSACCMFGRTSARSAEPACPSVSRPAHQIVPVARRPQLCKVLVDDAQPVAAGGDARGREARRDVADAQRPAGHGPKAVEAAVALARAGRPLAAAHLHPVGVGADLGWGAELLGVGEPLAELAVGVPAPAVERAGGADAAAVPLAGGDEHPVVAVADAHRGGVVGARVLIAEAELPFAVVAPAPQARVGEQRAGVVEPGAQIDGLVRERDRTRIVAGREVARAQLSGGVAAPARDAAVGRQAAAVASAGRRRQPRAAARDDHGTLTGARAARGDAEPPVAVVAPAGHRAARDGAGVVLAG